MLITYPKFQELRLGVMEYLTNNKIGITIVPSKKQLVDTYKLANNFEDAKSIRSYIAAIKAKTPQHDLVTLAHKIIFYHYYDKSNVWENMLGDREKFICDKKSFAWKRFYKFINRDFIIDDIKQKMTIYGNKAIKKLRS